MKNLNRLILVVALVLLQASLVSAGKQTLLAGPYAPFIINKGLYPSGIAIDTYSTIMDMTGTPFNKKDVKFVEWDMAYKAAEKMPNCVLLGVPRTLELEEKFKWVGPIDFPSEAVIGKSGVEYPIQSVEDVSKYKIGVVRDSDVHQRLLALGVPASALKVSSSSGMPLRQLQSGSVDLVAYTDMEISFLMKRLRLNVKKYKIVLNVKKIPLYFAFCKTTDDALIKKYNEALAAYKTPSSQWESPFDKNVRTYLPKGVVEK